LAANISLKEIFNVQEALVFTNVFAHKGEVEVTRRNKQEINAADVHADCLLSNGFAFIV